METLKARDKLRSYTLAKSIMRELAGRDEVLSRIDAYVVLEIEESIRQLILDELVNASKEVNYEPERPDGENRA